MGRPRIYETNAEKYRAYRQRRRLELEQLRQRTTRHPRHDHDLYETPPEFSLAGLQRVSTTPGTILDIGAGAGVWGAAARCLWPKAHICGVELRQVDPHPAYDVWHTGDVSAVADNLMPFDLVMGNPPFAIAEECVRAGLSLLEEGGELLFFLRLAFSEGRGRARGLYTEYPLAELAVCDRRPRLYGYQGGMTAFAYFRWLQGFSGRTEFTNALIPKPLPA